MKEFLDNLYKQCVSSRADGVDALFDVIPTLLGEKKFEVVNGILKDIDLSRVQGGTMYSLLHLVSNYREVLPEYKPYYQRVREDYARRGESSERIADLFDRYQNDDPKYKYDPNAPPNKGWREQQDDKLQAIINRARDIGDKDIVDYLTYYQADMETHKQRDRKFRELSHLLGEEELRKRCIKSLRETADLLEKSSGCWPGIYYCNLPEDPLLKKTFIDGIEVVISYPWPG